jgi:hypothetical protein
VEAAVVMVADRISTADGVSAAAIFLAGEASIAAEVLKGIAVEAETGTAVFVTGTTAFGFMAAAALAFTERPTIALPTRTAMIPGIATRPDIMIDGAIGGITPVATPIHTIRINAVRIVGQVGDVSRIVCPCSGPIVNLPQIGNRHPQYSGILARQ